MVAQDGDESRREGEPSPSGPEPETTAMAPGDDATVPPSSPAPSADSDAQTPEVAAGAPTPEAAPEVPEAAPEVPELSPEGAELSPEVPEVSGDATAPVDVTALGDATAEVPPQAAPGPSGTAVMPPVAATPEQPRWAGRAVVPTTPARPEDYVEPWVEPPRSILVPVLVTVCVMLLLGVAGFGAFLILDNARPSPTPSPTASPSVTPSPSPSLSPSPTQTTASPSPTSVLIPPVEGDDFDTAAAKLTALGLDPHRRDEFNDAPAGTVIGTDPPEGTAVLPSTIVTIIVSLGPQPSPSPTSPEPTVSESA